MTSGVRLSIHHGEAFILILTEASYWYAQMPSPEMATFYPKRKQFRFIENFVHVPLQLRKLVNVLALLVGSHIGIIFI